MSWLLGTLTLLGIAALVYALFGLRRARSQPAARRYRLLTAAAVFLLAAAGYFGWPGPFGGFGPPLGAGPDVPRASLRTDQVLKVAREALGPSNRGLGLRIESLAGPAGGDAETAVLLLRANDAPNENAMRRQILEDAWAVFRALYEAPLLARIQLVGILVTHPSGRLGADGGEPAVAEASLTRRRFEQLNPPGVSAEYLEDVADVRWYPPLDD